MSIWWYATENIVTILLWKEVCSLTFGAKLQSLRKQSGLSQEQLALQLGVSRQAVSKWELNDSLPDTQKIVQLSNLLNVTIDYLLKDGILNTVDNPSLVINKSKRHIRWLGIGCVLFSAISFVVVWILAKIYPAPIVYFNPDTQLWKVGLPNFIWAHGLENFMLILGVAFIVGIILIFHERLKKLYKIIRTKLNRTK